MSRLLLPTVLLGLIVRLAYTYSHDFWFDEAFSFFVAQQKIPNLIQAIAADNHPPLYFLILHVWIAFFGNGEITLRTLSLLFGLGSILVYYHLILNRFAKKIALVATMLFSLAPLLVYYSGETRMYSLLTFLTLLSTAFWINFLKKSTFRNAAAFILCFVLALFTHYFAYLLFLPYSNLVILFKKQKLKRFIVLIFSFLLSSFWLYIFASTKHPPIPNQPFWIAIPATFASFILGGTGIVSLRDFFTQSSPLWIQIMLLLTLAIVLSLCLRGIITAQKTIEGRFFLSMLVLPLIFLGVTSLFLPIFSIRPAIFLAPYFLLLVALGIQSLPKRKAKMTLIITCLLFLAVLLLPFINPVFKGPLLLKTALAMPKNALILHTSILTYYPLRYYLKDSGQNILITKNPLSPKTVNIIGGQTGLTTQIKSDFYLIDIVNGADLKQLKEVKSALNQSYFVVNIQSLGAIRISRYSSSFIHHLPTWR